MPIAVATSPALAFEEDGPVQSAQFTPSGDALLVMAVMFKATAVDLSNTGAGDLTWTQRVTRTIADSTARIYTAPAINQTMRITAETDSGPAALKAYVLTGADLTQPVGQTGNTTKTGSGGGNWSFPAYTSSVPGSWGLAAAVDDWASGDCSSTDVFEEFFVFPEDGGENWLSGLTLRKSAATSAQGSSVAFNIATTGFTSADTTWAAVAVEIRPAPTGTAPAAPPRGSPAAVHRAASW